MVKRKLLFILDQFNIGGPQKSLLGLFENIDTDRFDVFVTSIKDEGILKNYLPQFVNIIECPIDITACLMPSHNTLYYLHWLFFHGKYAMFFSFFRNIIMNKVFHENMNVLRQKMWVRYNSRLSKIIGEYDAVFAYGAGLTGYIAIDSVSSKNKYYRIANDYRIVGLDKTIEEMYFKRMNGFISVSKKCGDIFKEEFPFVKDIEVFYNFIPVHLYSNLKNIGLHCDFPKNCIKIFTTCRIDKLKGFEYIIETAKILNEQKINYCWYIIGDGPNRKEYEEKCKLEGLNNIQYLGFLINPSEVFQNCQIMVHPSISEGKSNAVDEAKYYGIPVIATRYPTVNDQIIDEVTGLISEYDSCDIANKIIKLINDKELYKTIVKNTYHLADADKKIANDMLEVMAD